MLNACSTSIDFDVYQPRKPKASAYYPCVKDHFEQLEDFMFDEDGLENLARYIIRASFSQERMTYIPANDSSDGVSKVNYQSKDGTSTKTFDAPDWLAQLVTHIPNKGEQMVRYYGFYSNKSRGLRKKADTNDAVPALIESEVSPRAFRKNWTEAFIIYHQPSSPGADDYIIDADYPIETYL